LPENHGCPNLFFPNHWSRHVKSALLHVISLARFACVHTWAWAAGSLDTRTGQEVVADNTRWSRPRKARSFRRLISAAYTTSTRGRRDRIRVLSNLFREGFLRRVGKNGPFVPVGEPIAAVNWRKGDAAQQRNLKNPQVSTPMEFLVGTRGFAARDLGTIYRSRRLAAITVCRRVINKEGICRAGNLAAVGRSRGITNGERNFGGPVHPPVTSRHSPWAAAAQCCAAPAALLRLRWP